MFGYIKVTPFEQASKSQFPGLFLFGKIEEMKLQMKLNSAYLCVKDMDRAIKFYERFLNQKADVKDKVFSKFYFKGFRLCLFNPKEVNEKVVYGDNCLLSFEVNDINSLIKKLKRLRIEIVYPLTKISNNWILEFRDTEGNDIEVYSKVK